MKRSQYPVSQCSDYQQSQVAQEEGKPLTGSIAATCNNLWVLPQENKQTKNLSSSDKDNNYSKELTIVVCMVTSFPLPPPLNFAFICSTTE